jgi:hypothetical protein
VVDEHDDASPEARPPTVGDLVALCRRLNDEAARYIVVGGMAMIQAGFVRATEDIDLLIDTTADNVLRVQRALLYLPDQAAKDLRPTDIEQYVVVRVADEIVVDLLGRAAGVTYAEAVGQIEMVLLDGVTVPFANPALLWKTKQTVRDKDELDRIFLARVLAQGE